MTHKTERFDRLVRDAMDEHKVPGFSIAIIHGEEIWSKGYGVAQLSGEPVTSDTIFDFASLSKSITASAVALLVQDNEKYPDVQWTTPVSKLLPEDFVLEDDYSTKNITIEDILSHRTGYPRHDDSYLGIRSTNPDNAATITRSLRHLPSNKPLRTTYQYNNIMYTVASHIVSTLTSQPYANFLEQNVFKPLNMANTHHDVPTSPDAVSKLAHPHHWDKDTEKYIEIPMYAQPEGQGAGLIFTSASDYALHIQALMTRSGPLSAESHDALRTPRIPIQFDEDTKRRPFYSHAMYGFGCWIENYRGFEVVGHNGGVAGFGSVARWVGDKGFGFVTVGNGSGAAEIGELVFQILLDDVIGVTEEEKVDWVEYARKESREEEEREKERKEKEKKEAEVLERDRREPTIELREYAGTYSHGGYHGLVVEFDEKEGVLKANCEDRCMPLLLTFKHKTGDEFLVEQYSVWGAYTYTVKGAFRVADEKVEAVGVAFEPAMEDVGDGLIWFTRVK